MKRWLTTLILLFALVGGLLAGTPVFSGNAESGMSAMACCKKKSHNVKSISAAQLCCLINCNSQTPNPSGSSFNFSPSAIIISDSISNQFAPLLKKIRSLRTISYSFERKTFSRKFQPKYIQNHSFLI